MADNTSIEWTDFTLNPTTGCDRVSPGCDNCYALGQAKRLKAMGSAKYQTDGDPVTSGPGFGLAMHPATLEIPLRLTRPRRIFVNSMSDLFHAQVSDAFIAQVWATMALSPRHTYQILTKRHGRMRALLGSDRFSDQLYPYALGRLHADHLKLPIPDPAEWPLPNVHLGVSVENQRWADARIPALLGTPAAVRWLSVEPLLGPVDLTPWLDRLDWVVVGGESGAGARPVHPDWVRSLRDQCAAAKPAPRGERSQGAVGSLPLHPNQERADLSQEVEDIDLSSDVPGAERFGAPTSGFDPVHATAELGEPANDVPVSVDDPNGRVTVSTSDDASVAQQETSDHPLVGVRVDEKGTGAQRRRSAEAEPRDVVADRVAVDVEQGRDFLRAHATGVHLGHMLTAPVEDAPATVRPQGHVAVFEQGSEWGGAALVASGDLIEARSAGVHSDDLIGVGVQPVPDVPVPHDATIHRRSADQCVAAGVPFLFKQWGESRPLQAGDRFPDPRVHSVRRDESGFPSFQVRVGKKAAGRELDGRTWDGYPAATAGARA